MQNFMPMIYSIQVPCRKSNLKRIRAFVETVLERYYVMPTEANLMVLAVDEVCANLMIHSHQCNPSERIQIRIKDENDNIVFEIHDHTVECFNMLDHKTPDMQQVIKERKNGGIGLILVKKIMDKIQIEREGNHNICRLYKKALNPKPNL